MKTYIVRYKISGSPETGEIIVKAKSKADAYIIATYEAIPEAVGEMPYSSWVYAVVYKNGRVQHFNTCEGLGY